MWEKRESLPHRIGNLSMIELNGLIYVVGRLKRTQNCTSNFWCYNPISNVWTEKAHTTVKKWSPYQFVEINLVKIDETICISNTEIGFIKYDSAANRWTEVCSEIPIIVRMNSVNFHPFSFFSSNSTRQYYTKNAKWIILLHCTMRLI